MRAAAVKQQGAGRGLEGCNVKGFGGRSAQQYWKEGKADKELSIAATSDVVEQWRESRDIIRFRQIKTPASRQGTANPKEGLDAHGEKGEFYEVSRPAKWKNKNPLFCTR